MKGVYIMGKKKKPIKFPPMTDFDTCTFCGSHNGPWTWLIVDKTFCFCCDECYDKHFAHLFNKDTRG